MQNVTLADGTVIRALASHEEREEAVRIQEETWGAGFSEKIPAAMLLVAEETGGIAAAAVAPSGRMLGFIFGVSGVRDGKLVHWSDMLAVRKEAQGRKLGEAMKRYQRDRCRALGIEKMYWTYDPFVAKNAHLNLNLLGARVEEFVVDMYGTATNSPMHGSLGTDRFVVAWPITSEPSPLPAHLSHGAPVVAGPGVAPDPFPDLPSVAVTIPHDYAGLLAGDLAVARAWRLAARHAFTHYLGRGYRVSAFAPGRGRDAAYLLSSE
jgi:chorismate synthase